MSQKAEIRLLKLAQHRSVMPIIWYKKKKQPMRFPVVVESYPNFILSSTTAVVDFLKLSPSDHLETWNNVHNQWEMHQLGTPRRVTEDQCLLYRIAPDISSTLEDDECPGLAAEIALQPVMGKRKGTGEAYILPVTLPSSSTANLPHAIAPLDTTVPPTAISSNPSPALPIASSPFPALSITRSLSPSLLPVKRKRSINPVKVDTEWMKRKTRMKAKCKGRGKENGKGKGKATVQKRVWPTHFHVCEVANGMQFIHNQRHQSGNTITSLFESFYGQEIKLSTFKLNRNLWNDKLPEELKRHFIAYGETRRGLWPKLLYAYHNDGNELMDHPNQVSTSSDNGSDTSSTGSCPSDNERGISKALDKCTSPDLPEASDLLKSSSLSKASSHSDAAASPDGLCCFCFLPLPPVLSPTLQSKLAELLLPANSLPDPTEDFPGGWRHRAGRGWTLRLEYCGGHFRQSQVSAKVIGQNWPKPADIDYSTLPCHIESL
ncbi:hypothetical protein JB92DRAFT_309979 [Gautieria morchelliformis]|nr:hypothetical protein JB92DRAFT_309979 [Gautieria morchelliformis]